VDRIAVSTFMRLDLGPSRPGTDPVVDRLTVHALSAALRPGQPVAETVKSLGAIAGGDSITLQQALQRLEDPEDGAESPVASRAAMLLREALRRSPVS